jgi:sterol 3beta-glucosyltransferase
VIDGRVAILTYGTRGDVEPFVALAKRLKNAGMHVVLAAPEVFRPFAAAHGVELHGLPGNPQELARQFVEVAALSRVRMISVMIRHVTGIAREVWKEAREVCVGADCVVHSFLMTSTGHLLATENAIPEISAQLFPVFSSTREFSAPTFPDLALGPIYRRLTHSLNSLVYWEGGRPLYARLRRRDRALPPYPSWPFGATGKVPVLYAYSPAILPAPRDWGPRSIVTGYWFLDPPLSWEPPADLLSFLESGSPPVYVGFGSMQGKRSLHAASEVVRALRRAGLRGVLAVPDGAPEGEDLPPGYYRVGDAPHAWLFPKMAAVVHHGGAGTTGAALRAGRPSVIVPLTADQSFWARRVHRLGAGPAPVAGTVATADRLAEAIRQAVEDPSIEARAVELGKQIAGEDGTGRAVKEIARVMAIL